MHKTLRTMFASVAAAMLLTSAPASATVYRFTFESFELGAYRDGNDDSRRRRPGHGDDGLDLRPCRSDHRLGDPNSNFPGSAYSPDGSFIYNNLYHSSGMAFDIDGVLFSTSQNPGGYWNLWGGSPGVYSLWESASSYNYPIEESGSLGVAAVPELSTWAMLGFGFAALGVAGRRRLPRLAERSIN